MRQKRHIPYFNTAQVDKVNTDHLLLLKFFNTDDRGRIVAEGDTRTLAMSYESARKLAHNILKTLEKGAKTPKKCAALSNVTPFAELRRLFASSPIKMRLQILNIVHKRKKPGESSLILGATSDQDVRVRRLATKLLGSYPSEECLSQLLQQLQDDDKVVRLKAIEGLSKIGNASMAPVLSETIKNDPSATVRRNIASVLSSIGDAKLISTFIAILKDDDEQVRLAAVQAFEKIGGTVATAALSTALKDISEKVRLQAIDSLGIIGDDTVVPLLSGALSFEESPEIRKKSVEALGNLKATSVHGQLLRILKNKTEPEEVLAAVILALGKMQDYRDIPELLACLKSHSHTIRKNAAIALGNIKDPSALSTLQTVLQHDSALEVREAAAIAVGKIGGETASRILSQHRDKSLRVREAVEEALHLMGEF